MNESLSEERWQRDPRTVALKEEIESLSQQVKRLIKAEGKLYEFQEQLDAQLREYAGLYDLHKTLNTVFNFSDVFTCAVPYVINTLGFERVLFLHRIETAGGYAVCGMDGFYDSDEKNSVMALSIPLEDPLLTSLSDGVGHLVCTQEYTQGVLDGYRSRFRMNEYLVYPIGSGTRPLSLLVVGNSVENAGFYRRVNESENTLLSIGNFAELVASSLDNTVYYAKMKNALEQERVAKAKYRSIFENSVEGIFQTSPEGVFLSCNPATAAILGYGSPEELIAGIHNIDKQLYVNSNRRRELFDMILRGLDVKNFEVELYRKDGSLLWALMSIRPFFDQNDRLLYLDGILHDITERKWALDALKEAHDTLERTVEKRTAELRAAKEAAETANRAKSSFLSNMSHELRTPLNAILGYSQLMQRDPSLSAEKREQLNTINSSGEHLLRLINDVLEISKIEAQRVVVEMGTFDLHVLLRELHSMFRIRTEAKKLHFQVEGISDLPLYIVSDEGKLRQILINLIDNAVKFTEKGGIVVRLAMKDGDDDNSRLIVEVQDSGSGIADGEQEKVFQAFEQTASGRHSTGGTGLGMTISRNYAQMLGGDIFLCSRLGEGSTFRMEINVREGRKSDIKEKVHLPRVKSLKPGQKIPRILVVEDFWDSRSLLVKLLTIVGYNVREAVNGREAVDICAEWRPDFIWMDIRMPVMGGLEAMRLIRGTGTGKTIKIVAITASGLVEDQASIMTSGFDDFVRKPFREQEVLEVMARHLGVSYLYEADEEATSPQEVCELSGRQLALDVDEDLLCELRGAVLTLDTDRTLQVIEKISTQESCLGAKLKKLALDLDYDSLLSLLEEGDVNPETQS